MLGRQQIAGIPTAISELFKNAHDAYARNVEVDYYRDDQLFILRDNGLGMTRDDFEQRWLTLGTESKAGSPNLQPPPTDPDQPKRPVLGEKGIGRLAIAAIGPQVLVLSRAKVNGKPYDKTIAAYLHWGLFELPGLNLEDISIPMREVPGGTLPNRADIKKMVTEAASALNELAPLSDKKRVKEIQSEMEKFSADPLEYSEFLGKPSLQGSGCGTHFYIIPADPIINDDIDNRQADNKATRFEKHLIGFTNTMTPNHADPPIVARFRDHKDGIVPVERIGEKVFFTPEEYEEVDHHFLGRFDEYGQFCGQIGIYQMQSEDYVLNWGESDGKPTACGPFNLSFAYMQGVASESLVSPKEHAYLKRKLDRHGGLYIYRDGIRIQPYGDSDYDWLDIERNRTLGAAYYFYSYRRMFGVIELSQTENKKLTEKAGREGFRENLAYRQFRSILMNFFLQTAGDFFRTKGKHADTHIEKRSELKRNEKIRRLKAKQVREKRASLQNALQETFATIEAQKPELDAEEILATVKQNAPKVLDSPIADQEKAQTLVKIEKQARERLNQLRKSLTVVRPRGVGLSRNLSNEWDSYSNEMERLESKVFGPLEAKIEDYISAFAQKTKIPLDYIARLDAAVSQYGNNAVKTVRRLRDDVNALIRSLSTTITEETRSSFRVMCSAVDGVMDELGQAQNVITSSKDLAKTRERFVGQITATHEAEKRKLERLLGQLKQVEKIWSQDGYDSMELTEALEEELDELKARRDADFELTQIGMALNVISHEFNKTVGTLRDGLRKLKAWSDVNPELNNLYQDIRVSFDHLDEYLTLFTPLDRRLHRTSIDITGKHVYDFLSKLFQARLNRHNVALVATKEFRKFSISCYPSSLYPPFVNLVDNSIFWLQQNHDNPKEIVLDVDKGDLLIRDNGPGVSMRDRENIFAMNFSRRPGGRGMGLSISRETLAKVNLNLTLDPDTSPKGAIFRVSPMDRKNTKQRAKQ